MIKKTIFLLSSCSTCIKIKKTLGVDDTWIQREIKTEPLTLGELTDLKDLAGSYENLFSRRSMKYRAWNLKEKVLTEHDYRDYILKEYTFLKRPVVILGSDIFIGNSKKVVEEAMQKLGITKS